MGLLKIGIVVGERSGEKLAVDLIKSIRKSIPNVEVYGVMGKELRDLGCVAIAPMETISVMGFVEPLLNLRKLIKFRRWVVEFFIQDPPDVFIGIDAPAFNLYVEDKLHKQGIPTIHYVSPSVWAWKKYRIKTIKSSVDLMLTLFPFEKKFYDQHQVDSIFVGHPAADKIPLEIDTKRYRDRLNIPHNKTVLAMLPGSRNGEIKSHLNVYLDAASLLLKEINNLHVIIPCVSDNHKTIIEQGISELELGFSCDVLMDSSWDVLGACDFAIVTSGTASLELMLHKKPMVIAYRTHWLNYQIAKKLVTISHIGLPNLIAGEGLIVELIQDEVTAENIYFNLKALLNADTKSKVLENKFIDMHKQLRQDASKKAASAILSMLGLENNECAI